eukprot:TRINITY_DN2798_c1_g2_i1.p1 TRINITY_DN2798_c1_g2~~TRINITY_DN2798_c1_g2_i1.p1  ORF type:complete len:330 (+),score=71.35 TRINITY_DN2798_c1_g2_i1:47-1036(+)
MAADDTELRNLAQSTLHKEGVLTGGHKAVWGSFFNKDKQLWGYSCCKSTSRGQACPLQDEKEEDAADSSEEEEDPRAEAARQVWRASRLLDGFPPEELKPRDAFTAAEDYLAQFVMYWFHKWASGGNEKHDKKAISQMREALLPLMQGLEKKAIQKGLLGNLVEFSELASRKKYMEANDVYIAITIGKATWHTNLDLGEQRAHWGGGCNLRTMQRQVVEKDLKNASLFDTDPSVQRYVHSLKRLLTFMQIVEPSEDPSQMGCAQAPVPDASECNLPVMRDIRATDGTCREPEFLDPSEASSVPMMRGLAFGKESGLAHPFHGIGNARGI